MCVLNAPSNVFFEFGAIEKLSPFLEAVQAKRILIVHGQNSYGESGLKSALERLLSHWDTGEWITKSTSPSLEEAEKGVLFTLGHKPDVIVAAGGGSVLDMGKLIGIFSANEMFPQRWIKTRETFFKSSIPIVAIPSTAGTGSEATHFAVIWHGKEKFSAAHDSMRPELVLVDPQFHRSLPQPVRASSSFDALAQAIESYWSVHATDVSKEFAVQAIRMLLPCIVLDCFDDDALLQMAKGAYYAGKSIDLTTTTAPHAVSYAFTGYYRIPHGHAVALTLPSFFEFNGKVLDDDCLDSRGVKYVRKTLQELANLLGAQDSKQARHVLEGIIDKLGLERKLSAVGLQTEKDIDCIVEHGFNADRVSNNPRQLTPGHLRKMLLSLK